MQSIQIKGVSYRYKNSDRNVLTNLTCHFEGGLVSAVVGPSGSGKTTLLALMAGLDSPTSGDILIAGEAYSSLNLDRLRREKIALIFQAFNLLPRLTALENVCYPMDILGIPKVESLSRGKALLQSVGISEKEYTRYPANLSGGEQQRVAIARALSTGARVLLADEPTGNLDEANAKNVMAILSELAHTMDYCVIVVTHSKAIAEASDRVFTMKDGQLIQA